MLCVPSFIQARIPDKGFSKTLEAFSRVACEDEDLFDYNKGLIRGLTYTNKRALRAFARLDCVSAEELVAAIRRLVTEKISFDNLLLLERFVTLKAADAEMSWQFLEKLGMLEPLTFIKCDNKYLCSIEFIAKTPPLGLYP